MIWIVLGVALSVASLLGAGIYSLLQILGEFSQG
ncbi:hypothetical protein SAMN05216602_3932 [Pseudomonas argentinensis]|uniref:Uncharacterized protein n=1 Tax=Phytopseudomonas argentinensis TaxID=289370 RepID=A0A1I3NP46_9GAMM|nr:hypothetical protein SAMN05216602_3932 [Pseudomonas argentinensis]